MLLAYCIFLWFKPAHWLIVFPVFTVLVDLVPWTGAFLFNELDVFIISTFTLVAIRQGVTLGNKRAFYFLIALLCSLAVATLFNVSSLPTGSSNTPNPYYSFDYAIKVLKGFVYAFLIAVIAFAQYQQNPTKMKKNMFLGSWLGSLILFIIVLWERHTLVTLVNFENWWSVAASLLDFTSSYRVTGLLSDMHTGGEAFDGILMALFFINLMSLSFYSKSNKKYLALLALLLVTYCILVGFTRATYAAIFVGTCFYGVVTWRHNVHKFSISRWEIFAYCGVLLLCFGVFKLSGFGGFAVTILMLLALATAAIIAARMKLAPVYVYAMQVPLILGAIYMALAQQGASKWVEQTGITSAILAGAIVAIALLLLFIFANFKRHIAFKAVSLTSLAVILSLVFGTYQFNSRVGSTYADIFTRFAHWQTVVDSSNTGWMTTFIGNGMGAFPYNYVLSEPDVLKQVGSFQVAKEQLVLGFGGDLTFAQRVKIPERKTLNVQFDAVSKETDEAIIELAICQRNIIYSSNFNANCLRKSVKVNRDATSPSFQIEMPLSGLKHLDSPLFQWPWTFAVTNLTEGEIIYLDNLRLTQVGSPVNLLNNADFANGTSYWFFYNDYEHLPWHIKNIYLAIFYQAGVIGLVFLFLFVFRIISRIPNDESDKRFVITVSALTYALLVFGLVGDPLDSARSASLLLFILFLGYFIASNTPQYQVSFVGQTSNLTWLICGAVVTAIMLSFGFQFVFQKPVTEISTITPYSREHKPNDIKRKFSIAHQEHVAIDSWNNSPVGPQLESVNSPFYPGGTIYEVTSANVFKNALAKAKAGDTIILSPGTYYFKGHALNLTGEGNKDAPITIRAAKFGEVTLQFDLVEGFKVTAPNWHLENLVIEGVCKNDAKCEHALHISGRAQHFRFTNGLIKNFNSPIKVNQKSGQQPDHGIIESSAVYNDAPRSTVSPVTLLDLVSVSHWTISESFIADFAKGKGDLTSYGMFYKGAGANNVFERNVVSCEWRHRGGQRIGASLGGGGTEAPFCRDGRCQAEQFDSIMRNNIVLNCPEDVGIYLNKASNSTINNNLVINTRGIDLRFPETSAMLYNNIIEGRVWARNGAASIAENNMYSSWKAFLLPNYRDVLYHAPLSGNFELKSFETLLDVEASIKEPGEDLCGNARDDSVLAVVGPFAYKKESSCQTKFGFLNP